VGAGVALLALAVLLWWTRPDDSSVRAEDATGSPSENIASGSKAPDFELEVFGGGSIELSKALEKGPVLVDFWATWCTPCLRAMPSYQKLYAKYRNQGFTVLAVSQDVPKAQKTIGEFFEKRKLEFPALLDGDGKVAGKYGVMSLPTSFLVAPDGRVVSRHTGFLDGDEKELEAQIQALLPDAYEGE
jgi:peroxiredoxin